MKLQSKVALIVLSLVIFCGSVYVNYANAENEEGIIDDSSILFDQMVILDENGVPTIVENEEEPESQTYTISNEPYDVVVNNQIIATEETYKEANKTYAEVISSNQATNVEQTSSVNKTESAPKFMTLKQAKSSKAVYEIKQGDKVVRSNQPSIVRFQRSWNQTISYKDVTTKRDGYFTGGYANDAVYIQTNSDGTVRCKFAGVIADVPQIAVLNIVPYSPSEKTSYYATSNGRLYHYFTYISGNEITLQRTWVGYQQDYMANDAKYYSYDGHYFYNDFATMANDYISGTYSHSINSNKPYYNYYQFLSVRSKTALGEATMNQRIIDNVGNKESKMKNTAGKFIEVQNNYGTNAALLFGIGINESASGTSNIAKQKNNLFGYNAVDSNAGEASHSYKSVEACIEQFSYQHVSKEYLNGTNWVYTGAFLGDKASGMNVRYASDPYWGEKAAQQCYHMDQNKSDINRYEIAIAPNASTPFYKEADTSKRIYTSGDGSDIRIMNFAIVILDEVTGSDGQTWYKVQSDMPLKDDRTGRDSNLYWKKSQMSYSQWGSIKINYNFDRDYVFVKASDVMFISQNHPGGGGGDKPTPPSPTYKRGDVNGDGNVTSLDYIQIKNHIMQSKYLSGDALGRADVNGDGNVTSLDYIKIKNHIMGTNPLF